MSCRSTRARRGVTLATDSPPRHPGSGAISATPRPAPWAPGIEGFNTAPAEVVALALLGCCASPDWARRLVDHRPYPDLDALLAAADEAAYDLSPDELTEALSRESLALPPGAGYSAAHTALSAAHVAYENRFGHVFVICLDGYPQGEALDQVLAGIRARLTNEPEEERVLAAEELRRLARGRITRLVYDGVRPGHRAAPAAPVGREGRLPPRRSAHPYGPLWRADGPGAAV